MARLRWSPGPTLRIALGLISLVVVLLMVANFVFDLLPSAEQQARRLRSQMAESATMQVTDYLRNGEVDRVAPLLDGLRERNRDLESAALRDTGGQVLASSGAHAPDWRDHAGEASTVTRVVVPIRSAQGAWGRMEFAFAPVHPQTLAGWLRDRQLWLALLLPLAGLVLVYLYLRRALVHLNPMSVVPERLRDAFDALAEGLALMDSQGRVVLANEALRRMAGLGDDATVHGSGLAEGLRVRLAQPTGEAPWQRVLRGEGAVRGERVLVGPDAQARVGMLSCSPIVDAQGRTRGCLATIDDVTDVEQHNEELRRMLAELERSRQQIEAQNQELVRLATRDALTGLLNRRAFFDTAGHLLERGAAAGRSAAILMIDVDHFKSFNDRHGHAVGDQVLQGVARQLTAALRQNDLVARYGGEEFCVLLDVADLAQAQELAERVRRQVQAHAGQALHDGRDLSVTASIGLALHTGPGRTLSDLLSEADAALYDAKRSGRNRVELAKGLRAAAPQGPRARADA